MFKRRQDRTTDGHATAYRAEGLIAVEVLTEFESASAPTDLVFQIEPAQSDLELGDALIEALDLYGRRDSAPDSAVQKVFEVSSMRALVQMADCVSVSRREAYNEIVMSPWRKHPPGGYVGNIEDPVFVCPAANRVGAGHLLRLAFDLAASLPPGR